MASAATTTTEEAGSDRGWGGGAVYLAVLLTAPVVYEFLLTVAGDGTIVGWQPAILVLLLMAAAAIAAWLPYRPAEAWSWPAKAWLLLLVVLWLYLAVSAALVDGDGHLAAIIVPVTALLLYLKRPSRSGILTAADALALAVVGLGLLVLALEVTGVLPSWYDALGGRFLELDEYDRANHWFALGGLLGLDGRWGGPVRDPNLIGPVASLLVVYGIRRPGWRGATIVTAGVLFVVLADSRAAYGALLVALAVLVVLPGWGPRLVTWPRAVAAALAGLSGVRLAMDLVSDPAGSLTMTGRTGMWPDFLSLLDASPWTGVGTDAINQAVATGVLPPWSNHGHNLFVDTVVRYGWIGLALTALVLALVLLRAALAAWDRDGLPIAMMLAFLIVSLANLLLDWRYPSVALSGLLVIALLAASTPRRSRTR